MSTPSRTFTLLVTITDDEMADPVTEADLHELEDRIQRGLEEGVRGFGGFSAAMVHAFDGDETNGGLTGASHRMLRAKITHRDLREGR